MHLVVYGVIELNFRKVVFRSWFYFRVGYATYIALLIGIGGNLLLFYRLGVQYVDFLKNIFPSLTIFTLAAIAVTVPISVGAGLYHMKRTGAYAADATVATESNPYIYKVVPGKEQEVFLPLWIATVRSLIKVLDKQNAMTVEEKKELDEVLNKASALLEGQYVGRPREQGVRPPPADRGLTD